MGDSVANPAVALNYLAVPRTSVIGGLLFWPSRRSIVLLVMLAAAIFWLARRHVPWHAVADIPADRFTPSSPVTGQEPWFVYATELITVDSKSGANLIDLTTGRKIRRVYPATPRGGRLTYRRLGSGTFEHISPGPTFEICDVRTGNPIAQRTNLGVIGSFSQEMSVDGKYAITRSITTTIFVPSTTPPVRTATNPAAERPGAGPSSRPGSIAPDIPRQKFLVWELDQSLSPYELRPIGSILALTAFFTDAQTIAAYDARTLMFLRAKDLQLIVSHDAPTIPAGVMRVGDNNVLIIDRGPVPPLYALYSGSDGALLDKVSNPIEVAWSPDLSIRVVPTPIGSGAMRFIARTTDLIDRTTGKVIKRIPDTTTYPQFFPGSQRYLVSSFSGPYLGTTGIYDLRHKHPLAVFSDPPPAPSNTSFFSISPNGKSILSYLRGRTFTGYRLYHPTGWDCPESPLGMLAFPQTWLVAVLLAAFGISIFIDARRQSSYLPHGPFRTITSGLFVVCLLLTIHFALEACRGNLIRSPAPLVLLGAIGLARGSQIWRWGMVAVLSLTLAWCCFSLHLLRTITLDYYPILDRVYAVPHQVRLAAMIVVALGLVCCITALSFPRSADHK